MKIYKISILLIFIINLSTFAQPNREINCINNFNNSDNNQNNINAYLLSYMVNLMYPERLAREQNVSSSNLLKNDDSFFKAYVNKFEHWFYNPKEEPIPPKRPNAPSIESIKNCPEYKQYLSELLGINNLVDIKNVKTSKITPLKLINKNIIGRTNTEIKLEVIEKDPIIEKIDAFISKIKASEKCSKEFSLFLIAVDKYKKEKEQYQKQYTEYKNKIKTYNKSLPKFNFIYNTNNEDRRWRDPEAMLISTPTTIFVLFRGTDRVSAAKTSFGYDWGEWIMTDFAIATTDISGNTRGKVHSGFWNSMSSIKDDLIEIIKNEGGTSKKIWIAGHSLGAGQATLFGSYLQHSENINVQGIYVFASPSCVGDLDFANQIDNTFNKNGNKRYQRFEYRNDAITALPIDLVPGYKKAGVRNYIAGMGEGKYYFDRSERTLTYDNPGIGISLCHHHPEFYTNSLYKVVERNNQNKIATLPLPPQMPRANWEACSNNDFN